MTRYKLIVYRSHHGVFESEFSSFEEALQTAARTWGREPYELEAVEIDNREPLEWWVYETEDDADEAGRTGAPYPPAVITEQRLP